MCVGERERGSPQDGGGRPENRVLRAVTELRLRRPMYSVKHTSLPPPQHTLWNRAFSLGSKLTQLQSTGPLISGMKQSLVRGFAVFGIKLLLTVVSLSR